MINWIREFGGCNILWDQVRNLSFLLTSVFAPQPLILRVTLGHSSCLMNKKWPIGTKQKRLNK